MLGLSDARIQFETLRTVPFGSLDNAYTPAGVPYAHPIRILKILNGTNADIIISFDPTNEDGQDALVAGSGEVYDFSSNKANQAGYADQSKGTQIYLKAESAFPSSGNVYITCIYVSDSEAD